jgi:hypothetical protein
MSNPIGLQILEHYLYEYIHTHPIHMSIFKRLSQIDLKIHEVGHQEHIVIDKYVASY